MPNRFNITCFTLIISICLILCAPSAFGQGRLVVAKVFSDHMVLQQNAVVPVWGTAAPRTDVKVSIAGQSHSTVADDNGAWRVELDPLTATHQPQRLHIQAGEQVRVFDDILIGEVWLCAGQSNMAFPLLSTFRGKQTIELLINRAGIRLLDPQPTVSEGPAAWPLRTVQQMSPTRYFADSSWAVPGPDNAGRFSGVGGYFVMQLRETLDTPIGMIDIAVGGTPTESWVPRDRMLSDERLAPLERDFLDTPLVQSFVRDRPRAQLAAWIDAGRPAPVPEHPYRPGFMYQAGIEAVAPFPVAGILWYQGESNAEDAELHDPLFTAAVEAWRDAFKNPDLPILTVQLPEMGRSYWPEFRESQQRLADDLPGVYLAVALGAGHPTDVHPRDKQTVGNRLARIALNRVYGQDTPDTGPTLRDTSRIGSILRLRFDHTHGGLELRLPGHDEPRRAQPTGFWIAGQDRVFRPAFAAEIQNDTLDLTHPDINRPVAVRYAWEANVKPTLFNGEGLPAAPFRSDAWQTLRIACVGDSITHGVGTDNPDTQSYPAQLSQMLGPMFDVRRFGVSGSSVVNGLLQQGTGWDRGFAQQMAFQRSLVFAPDLVIINLGINDLTNEQFDVERFVQDYSALIRAYRELPNRPEVIIWHQLSPLFPGQRYFNHPRLAEIQQGLDRVARESGVKVIDMYSPLSDHAQSYPDKIHPDQNAARLIAEVTHTYLEELGLPVPPFAR